MRNYIEILDEIIFKLKDSEFENFRTEIKTIYDCYCSASEICGETKFLIKDFEKNNKSIRLIIGIQIDEFYEYCNIYL